MPNNHIGQDVIAQDFAKQLDEEGMTIIPKSGSMVITTKNSEYTYDIDKGMLYGGKFGAEGIKARVDGSTFGGSMIAVGRLYTGSMMEFVVWDKAGNASRMGSSLIHAIKINNREDSNV